MKINEKEAGDSPFKKTLHDYNLASISATDAERFVREL